MIEKPKRGLFIASICLAQIAMWIALFVIIGWFLKIPIFIQLLPSYTPMQFNTALCILLLSIAEQALAHRKYKISFIFSLFVLLFASITLSQYVFGGNYGIDHLFVRDLIAQVNTSHPGRMAPNTGLAFIFLSSALIILSLKTQKHFSRYHALGAAFLTALAFSLAILPLTGYANNITTMYAWGNLTRMALHTAFCIVILSGSLFLQIWLHPEKRLFWVPSTVGFSGLVISISLSLALLSQSNLRFEEQLQTSANAQAILASTKLNTTCNSLEHLRQRWEAAEGTPKNLWIADTDTYLSDVPFITGIAWVSDEKKINWLNSKGKNQNELQTILTSNPAVQSAFLKARTSKVSTLVNAVTVNGINSFLYISPISYQKKQDGFIVNVMSLPLFVQQVLIAPNKSKLPFFISIEDGHSILFSNLREADDLPYLLSWKRSAVVSAKNQKIWQLNIVPSDALLKSKNLTSAWVSLFVGLLMTLLSAFSIYFSLKAKETNAILKRNNQDLEAFTYAAAHDLKTPLRVIDNISKWLEEDLKGKLEGENLENIDMLRNRVKRMEHLLDDLLEYAQAGHFYSNAFNEIIQGSKLIEDIKLNLPRFSAGFTIQSDARFNSAELLRMPLQQILLNLINNSIKHHHKKSGQVDLSLEETEDDFIISVADDGPGIPPEYYDEVFKMLRTLKPRDQVEGSGMGLAIVKKYMDIFGGKIWIEANQPQGAIFKFIWPKKQQRKENSE